MSETLLSSRNLAFELYEVLDAEALTQRPRFAEHSRETFDAALGTARSLAEKLFAPHNRKGDEHEPLYENGSATLIPEVKPAVDAFLDAGFLNATRSFEQGGMQLPTLLSQACFAHFQAANVGSSAYPFLTMGAANLIESFGSEEQKQRFLQPIRNVVVVLLESFAGHYVGALGAPGNITPYFDKLSKEGLLFTQFFSNGTHTHQGMFATMACFPNLPGFEYLMQTPEGGHKFSGLPQLLSARQYEDVYVYNGDFAWDNQSGFFSNQGMTTFIGRNDYVDPVFSDPTWGVSDQDMFARGNEELDKLASTGKPFYALLQSLSNHVPYALPKDLPVERVTGYGSLDEHLTAMRYSDWALGQFFEKAKKSPYYKDTLFVVVGDHGFGSPEQLTEMDLHRFNVPLLLIAPGIQEKFGTHLPTVGTQVDIVPTIMGLLGGETVHQCWGRDLLNLPEGDKGFGVIKPSGSEQNVAIVSGNRILVRPKDGDVRVYDYQLGGDAKAVITKDVPDQAELQKKLESFIQTATKSLLDNTAGVVHGIPDKD